VASAAATSAGGGSNRCDTPVAAFPVRHSRDVCFFNAAAWSPLPPTAQEAGRIGVASPPAYNDEADVDRFVEIFCKLMRQ